MLDVQVTLEHLFLKLGLDSSEKDMDRFVDDHQLTTDVELVNASFWNENQRTFLEQNIHANNEWAMMIQILNELLHGE